MASLNVTVSDFPHWLDRFTTSASGKAALQQLDKEFPANAGVGPASFFGTSLRASTLRACYLAQSFEPEDDPDHRNRAANSKALKDLPAARAGIRRARKFFRDHKLASLFAIVNADSELRCSGIKVDASSASYRVITARFDGVLAALENHLREPRPFVACGAYADRNSWGCLAYDIPLDTAKRRALSKTGTTINTRHIPLPRARTMLLFDLVQNFRFASRGELRGRNSRMPGNKEASHYRLATAFLIASFRPATKPTTRDSQKLLEKFLKANNVRYCDWPAVRELHERIDEIKAEGD